MIPKGTAIGISLFRILWTPVQLSFGIYILLWTLDERILPPLSYHPILALFSAIPSASVLTIALLYLLCSILVGIGWHTRINQVVLALLSLPLFFHSASTYHNHYAFMLFITCFLAMCPSDRFFSLDAARCRRMLSPSAFHAWQQQEFVLTGQFLILLQTSFLYLFAAVNKMNPDWFWRWSSTPEFLYLSRDAWLGPLIAFFFTKNILWLPLLIVIGLMLFFAGGIFFARRYPWISVAGIIFHLLLELSLPVIIFTPMMMSIWVLAMFPAQHPWIKTGGVARQAISPPSRREGVRGRG